MGGNLGAMLWLIVSGMPILRGVVGPVSGGFKADHRDASSEGMRDPARVDAGIRWRAALLTEQWHPFGRSERQ